MVPPVWFTILYTAAWRVTGRGESWGKEKEAISALQVLSERRCTLFPSGSFLGHSCGQLQHKNIIPCLQQPKLDNVG